jgi:hypothetical protein
LRQSAAQLSRVEVNVKYSYVFEKSVTRGLPEEVISTLSGA